MKVKFYMDSGANIHSRRSEVIDITKDWGITDEEWAEMTDEQKEECVWDWANGHFEMGWEEQP